MIGRSGSGSEILLRHGDLKLVLEGGKPFLDFRDFRVLVVV